MSDNLQQDDLWRQRAHWLTRDTFAWYVDHPEGMHYALYYSLTGGMTINNGTITGGTAIPLERDPQGLSDALKAQFPHLIHYNAYKLAAPQSAIDTIIRGQIVIVAMVDGRVCHATGLQISGLLDDCYTYTGELGALIRPDGVTLRLWAPTSQSVQLHLFVSPTAEATQIVTMTAGPQGTWQATGDRTWIGKYYRYDVDVYVPATGRVERNLVTDPYSLALAMNSTHSLIVDLNDAMLKPTGWDLHTKPPLDAPTDIVLYELHVRDFSSNDATVPEPLRGKFAAFTASDSNGMHHLRSLAEAGLTHIHLLPAFDIATINEDPTQRREPTIPIGAASDSFDQAAAIHAVRDLDGFNWGYDPYHYTVPEGSYATEPNGTARILEFREMVQALHQQGLRVVMDVVYNHTHSGGQGEKSVLDRIVPGYYHRLNWEGGIEQSTCCANTATEHAMMEKLMLDSLRTWATHYGVDGFRFDLMGHHMKANMLNVQSMLHEIDPTIYVYGEGWDLGEVGNNGRGINATQFNLAGTGIGTFNDRVRDAVRGGSPFDSGDTLIATQGFINGLWYDPNRYNHGNDEERAQLLLAADQLRVSLAGNLAEYAFEAADGYRKSGWDIPYNGSRTGYNQSPQEQILYGEAHDNQTLYDNNVYKLPDHTTMADRVRVQNLGLDLLLLGQGIPFIHAGMEMLRSKSLERDSYNSGDWFNRLYFDYTANNFGVGLPLEPGNDANLMKWFLTNPALRPGKGEILQSVNHLRTLLTIRKSSPLFRLRTKEEVIHRLAFHNTGPRQIPGLIAMSLADEVAELPRIDPNHKLIVVAINATTATQRFHKLDWQGIGLTLHPALQQSTDAIVQNARVENTSGNIEVPARTTAVFVAQ